MTDDAARFVWKLARRHSWGSPVPDDQLVRLVAGTEDYGELERVLENEELTGREHLEYVARLQQLPEDEAEERIDTHLERFDLVEDADRTISEYSTGMRKKVGVIGAILHDPAVVFLDEPTTGLDPRAARTVRDTIAELPATGTTVFLSSHIMPVIEAVADLVGVIHEGRLVANGSLDELRSRSRTDGTDDLETAFLEITTQQAEETTLLETDAS